MSLFSLKETVKESCLRPRFNIAPSQKILAIRNTNSINTTSYFSWGISPRWASKARRYRPIINARAETVPDKTTFSEAFRRRRCLIPATGYYEWFRTKENEKQPHLISVEGEKCFAMAALWEPSLNSSSPPSCVIVTRSAQHRISEIHSRMPLIIDPKNYNNWLNSKISSSVVRGVLASPATITLKARRVGDLVNSTKNDGPECTEPY